MQSMIKSRTKKMLMGAAVAGLMASQASAALLIDIRRTGFAFGDPAGKMITIAPGGSVTVEVYLRGGDTDLPNGLGSFALGVRSFGETEGSPGTPVPWAVSRTPTDTVVNATAGTNATNATILDLGFSAGTNTDSAGIGSPDTNDTDLDRTGLGGTQSATGGWDPTYGKVPELLLGTATFTAPLTTTTTHAPNYTVSLNAFFSNAAGTGGGAVIKTLTGTDTVTNAVAAPNLITGPAQINGASVNVTEVIPEPGSLGLLAIATFGLLGRRRRA